MSCDQVAIADTDDGLFTHHTAVTMCCASSYRRTTIWSVPWQRRRRRRRFALRPSCALARTAAAQLNRNGNAGIGSSTVMQFRQLLRAGCHAAVSCAFDPPAARPGRLCTSRLAVHFPLPTILHLAGRVGKGRGPQGRLLPGFRGGEHRSTTAHPCRSANHCCASILA